MLETDVEIKAGAERFFDVYLRRPHHISNIITSQTREKIPSVEFHEDDQQTPCGEVGTLLSWNYVQEDGKAKVAKGMLEAIGRESNSITWKVIGGDLLEYYKSFKFNLQITTPKPKANDDDDENNSNSSVVHWILEYEKVHDDVPEPHGLLQLLVEISKDINTHLVTHTQSAALLNMCNNAGVSDSTFLHIYQCLYLVFL